MSLPEEFYTAIPSILVFLISLLITISVIGILINRFLKNFRLVIDMRLYDPKYWLRVIAILIALGWASSKIIELAVVITTKFPLFPYAIVEFVVGLLIIILSVEGTIKID